MDNESKILKLSVAGTLFFAVLGVSWGWLIKSEMILFDGLYSFIGVLLSSASLAVCRIIKERDNKDFYFGKYIFEPLVICFNSLILIIMCLVSMYNSVITLLSGGNIVNVSSAIMYSVVSTVGCGLIYALIKKRNSKEQSELIKSETVQWFMDFLLSSSILIAFLFVEVISLTKYSFLIGYIDPLMVLIVSLFCIKNPINRFVTNCKEVLGIKKPDNIYLQVESIVSEIKKDYGFVHAMTKVMKIGRSVRIEVNFVNDGDIKDISLEEMNDIKKDLYDKIDTGKFFKDLELTFVMGKDIYIEITA